MELNLTKFGYLFYFLISGCLFSNQLIGQSASRNLSWTHELFVNPMEISLSVVYEGELNVGGEEVSSYSISWVDTLGVARNFPAYNRPYELKVVARDKDSIVGKYTGLSTQMSHCMILTNSRYVELFFWIDLNMFFSSDRERAVKKPQKSGDNPELYRIALIGDNLNLGSLNHERREFAPIKINLLKQDRNVIDSYENKKIILKGNPEIITLNYVNKGALNPDPMPHFGPLYNGILAHNRYFLNMSNGKIRRGDSWRTWRGIRKCCEIDFRVIDPQLDYKSNSGEWIRGRKLIRRRKIDVNNFSDKAFLPLLYSLPY